VAEKPASVGNIPKNPSESPLSGWYPLEVINLNRWGWSRLVTLYSRMRPIASSLAVERTAWSKAPPAEILCWESRGISGGKKSVDYCLWQGEVVLVVRLQGSRFKNA